MSVFLTRQISSSRSSFSARSMSSGGAMSLNRGLQLVRGGQRLMFSGGSIYRGAGGYGARVCQSYSAFSSGSMTPYSEMAVIGNEKWIMQNLNGRLATYLEKVRSLKAANGKLELQIREFYEKRAPTVAKDFNAYFATISDLQAQILRQRTDNQRIILQIDNAQLAAEDYKIKYEMELNMHSMVEANVLHLRGVRDSLTLAMSDLEVQLEGLKEEVAYMKSNHEEVECLEQNVEEVKSRYSTQLSQVQVTINMLEVELQQLKAALKKQYYENNLPLELEIAEYSRLQEGEQRLQEGEQRLQEGEQRLQEGEQHLQEGEQRLQEGEQRLQEGEQRLQEGEQHLQEGEQRLQEGEQRLQEGEQHLQEGEQHLQEGEQRLQEGEQRLQEGEQRLQEGEQHLQEGEQRLQEGEQRLQEGEQRLQQFEQKKAVIISKTVEVEEHVPHTERRVKTIMEEIVDGKVVSSVVSTSEGYLVTLNLCGC